MIVKADQIARELEEPLNPEDPFIALPVIVLFDIRIIATIKKIGEINFTIVSNFFLEPFFCHLQLSLWNFIKSIFGCQY